MDIMDFKVGDTIIQLEVELYKDDVDVENEFSVFISHAGSSGYEVHHRTNFAQVGEIVAKYLEEQI